MIARSYIWETLIPVYNAQRETTHLGFDLFEFRDWLYQEYGLVYCGGNSWDFESPEQETLFLLKHS